MSNPFSGNQRPDAAAVSIQPMAQAGVFFYGTASPPPTAQAGTPPAPANRLLQACLSGNVEVELWPTGLKLVKDVKVNDELRGRSASGEAVSQRVVRIISTESACLRVTHQSGSFVCSDSHCVFDFCDNVVPAPNLLAGRDRLLHIEPGGSVPSPLEILSVEPCESEVVFGFTCEPDYNFFAGGVLQHNQKKQSITEQ